MCQSLQNQLSLFYFQKLQLEKNYNSVGLTNAPAGFQGFVLGFLHYYEAGRGCFCCEVAYFLRH